MTSQINSRHGLMLVVAIAVTAAVAGSVWAMGGQRAAMMEGAAIDVFAMHINADVANVPVHQVNEPF